jgi:GT2 family glycosyltransferase
MHDFKEQSYNKDIPLVAVVILNWNGKHFLEKFLPYVVASTYSNIQIVVADNASTDDSVAFVKTNYPFIIIQQNKINEGFAKGYNTALSKIDTPYFVLLNSDVEVTPGWIEPIIARMEADKIIAACQPKLLNFNNRNYFEYAGASGGWIDNFGYPFARGRILENVEEDTGQYNDAMPCFWASGAAMFVRASVYKDLGGLDEYFFAHQEEIDLCWRMQLSGHKIFVEPASVVYHVGGGTLPKENHKKTYLNFRNNLIMIYKNNSLNALLFKLPFRIVLDAIAAYRGLFSGNIGYFMAIVKAHFHFGKWFIFNQKKSLFVKPNNSIPKGLYAKSILWDYFVKKKTTFSEIIDTK